MSVSEISHSDFPRLAAAGEELQFGATSFRFETENGLSRVTWFSEKARVIGISLTVPEEHSESGDHVAYNDGKNSNDDEDMREFVYPVSQLPAVQAHIQRWSDLAPFTPIAVRELPIEKRIPTAIGAAAAAELIQSADPHRVLFYTGAGVSGGGEFPVQDYQALTSACGFTPTDMPTPNTSLNSIFVKDFFSDPDKVERMFKEYQKTLDVLYRDAATPAHIALAAIARTLRLKPSFFTTNYDIKHESQGSRIRVPKLMHGWHDEQWIGLSLQHDERRRQARESIEKIRNEIDVLVVVGAAADRRGALAEINAKTILAINSAEPQHLPYLGEEDYYLQASAQVALPAIAAAIGDARIQSQLDGV